MIVLDPDWNNQIKAPGNLEVELIFLSFFFLFFYYLFMIVIYIERGRDKAEIKAEGEAGSMHREPNMGFDPRSPGLRPGPKAGAKPLRHPGIPGTHFLLALEWGGRVDSGVVRQQPHSAMCTESLF